MRPVIFNYVSRRKATDFPKLEYDHALSLSKLDGRVFVSDCSDAAMGLSKTFKARESDDEPRSFLHLTKTKVQRESDDENRTMRPSQKERLLLLTKTERVRESDDAPRDRQAIVNLF